VYDEGRPWDPRCGCFDRFYNAIHGVQTMSRAEAAIATQLPTLDTFGLDAAGQAFNPSLVLYQGKVMALVRTLVPQTTKTVNFLGEVRDRGLRDASPVGESRVMPTLQGFEDCRLFILGGELWAIGSHGQPQAGATAGVARSSVVLLKIEGSEFVEAHSQPTDRYEKNWVPAVAPEGLPQEMKLIYATAPVVVLGWDHAARKVQFPALPANCGILRGGTALIPYKDGWLSLVHEVSGGNGQELLYAHRLVKWNKELTEAKPGKAFYFQKRGVEFAAGILYLEDKGSFYVSYGVEESAGLTGQKRAFVSEVAEETVEEMLEA
jgi:hypothetical protein